MVNVKIFNSTIKNKKIVVFCAGEKISEVYEKYQLGENILYIVDNYKSGNFIEIDKRKIPIISVNEIGDEIKDFFILISSLKFSKEIICQLDNIELFNNLDVYIPDMYFPEKIDSPLIKFDSSKEKIIPKVIHYCWFGKNEMPDSFKKNIESWKEKCPDYEIKRWDESNYDITKNKYMKQAYETKKWGFVPDYARLDIIYNYGGIYLDTDVYLLKNLDDLLSYKMFCGFETNTHINFGQGFGAVKNHRIIKTNLEKYETLEFVNKDMTFNLTASPIYQTDIMRQYGLMQNGKFQECDEYIILPKEYFSPLDFYGIGSPTPNSISIHQYAASWFEKSSIDARQKIKDVYNFISTRL